METITFASSTEEAAINYPPSCKIVDNVVISDEAPLYEERFGIGELLFEKLKSNPNFVGQIDSATGERMTFAEIKERSIKCALWLMNRGVRRGDVIGIFAFDHFDDFNPDSIIALLGCLFIGAYVYPHVKMDIYECRYLISLMKPKFIFVNDKIVWIMADAVKKEGLNIELIYFMDDISEFQSFRKIIETQEVDTTAVDEFRCIPIVNLDEIALFILSSRTSELPKMIMISHRALINNMLGDNSFAENGQDIITYMKSFRCLTGMIVLFQSIYFCKTRIIDRERNYGMTCNLIEKYNVKWMRLDFSVAVNMLKRRLFSKYRLSSLRKIVIGGTHMATFLQEKLIKALPHVEVILIYKTEEICGVNILQRKMNSNGYTINNTRLKVIDVKGETLGPEKLGELLWKSPCIMAGYYNNPQTTKAVLDDAGWLHSSEFGYYKENGEVYVRDRSFLLSKKDFVYPSQIERILRFHPDVYEAGVVLAQNDSVKEHMIAFVSRKTSYKSITEEELVKYIKDVFKDYKLIHCSVIFLNSLPYTENGAIAYEKLKESLNVLVKGERH